VREIIEDFENLFRLIENALDSINDDIDTLRKETGIK